MYTNSFRLSKSDIDRAFEGGHFVVLFQPCVSLDDERVISAEAFVRWRHPSFGLMAPGLFLDFVETQGRMADLTAFVVREAARAVKAWALAGRDWRVSVNAATSDLTNGVLPHLIERILADVGIEASRLVIEAPEGGVAAEPGRSLQTLHDIRAMGCGVALDSGGGLPLDDAEVDGCPFTEIKIGGSAIIRFAAFVQKTAVGRISKRLAYAKRHNLSAVAVGVEDAATLAALQKIGFTAVQGSYILRPVSADALGVWDGTWRRDSEHADHFDPVQVALAARPAAAAPPMRAEPETAAELEAIVRAGTASASPPRLIDTLPASTELLARDAEPEFELDDEPQPPVAAAEARDAYIDPTDDIPAESEETSVANRAPPLTATMIERPGVKVVRLQEDGSPELIARKIPGIDKPIAMRVREPQKKKIGSGLDSLLGR